MMLLRFGYLVRSLSNCVMTLPTYIELSQSQCEFHEHSYLDWELNNYAR